VHKRMADHLRRLATAIRDLVCGATGADAYRRYLAHHEAVHRDQPPLSRAEFFRDETLARWDGVRRCC